MPRNGATSLYYIPPGTEGFPDTTIESEKYNNYIHDVEADLNRPRPVIAGGTGADDADEALTNLGAEKASQLVTNYDAHVWYPGSFYSAIGATGAPPAAAGQTADRAFVGWVVSSDPVATPPTNQNVVVRAHDQSGATVPGRVYVREKKAGVWGVWAIDGGGVVNGAPPLNPQDGMLWWDADNSGQLYVWYDDGDSKQWVIASPSADPDLFLMKSGDTMVGQLKLPYPSGADSAVHSQYVYDAMYSFYNSVTTPAMNDRLSIYGNNYMRAPLKVQPGDSSIVSANSGTYTATWGGYDRLIGGGIVLNGGGREAQYAIEFFSGASRVAWIDTSAKFTVTGAASVGGPLSISLGDNSIVAAANGSYTTVWGGVGGLQGGGIVLNGGGRPSYAIEMYNYVNRFATWDGGGNFNITGVAYKPGGGAWLDNSDARIKNVEGEYLTGLEAVSKLRPVTFTFKGNDTGEEEPANDTFKGKKSGRPESAPYPNSPHYKVATEQKKFRGFVAQEVEAVLPEMVTRRSGYIDGNLVNDVRDLDVGPLVVALVNAVKELKARVEQLEGA